jgi:hypothetical protein
MDGMLRGLDLWRTRSLYPHVMTWLNFVSHFTLLLFCEPDIDQSRDAKSFQPFFERWNTSYLGNHFGS